MLELRLCQKLSSTWFSVAEKEEATKRRIQRGCISTYGLTSGGIPFVLSYSLNNPFLILS